MLNVPPLPEGWEEAPAENNDFNTPPLPAGWIEVLESGFTEYIQQAPEESFMDKVADFFSSGLSNAEKAQSAIAVTNAEARSKRPSEFMGPNRNVVVDAGMGLVRGAIVDAPETLLRAGRTLGMDTNDEIEAVHDFGERNFHPSFQYLNNPLRQDIVEGAASSSASIVTGAPGAVVGTMGGLLG